MKGKRDDLVRAAKTLLWRQGYEATSPRDLLKASGAGQGSLYHHFDGKLDLAATALEEVSVAMRARMGKALADDLPPLERTIRYLRMPRDGLKGCRMGRHAAEAAIAEDRLRRPVEAYFAELEARLAETLREAQQAGDLDPALDADALALMLVATVQGGYTLSRVHRDRAAMARATDAAVALLRKAGGGTARASHTQRPLI